MDRTPRDIGAAVAAARVRRRWSQPELAAAAGTSIATIKRLEASRESCNVSRGSLALVAVTLGLDFSELFGATEGAV